MPTLQRILADDTLRKALIDDCVELIDEEVQTKSGLSGVAIKAGYKLVKGVKPGFVADAVDSLLSPFTSALQPIVDEAQATKVQVSQHFIDKRPVVAEALLAITDKRAENSRHKAVRAMYEKLRPAAKKHVEDAVPRVGKLLEKYAAG
ncbi:MAG: hypothetical protein MUF54_05670 [Polyangiaceae bacterium]|jgi:hypothetical protein|nr:hypothetical protein [Polyangiaceae bacterium]